MIYLYYHLLFNCISSWEIDYDGLNGLR